MKGLSWHPGPTLVFVEHDERFGSRVATRIIDLDQGAGKTGSVSEDVKEKAPPIRFYPFLNFPGDTPGQLCKHPAEVALVIKRQLTGDFRNGQPGIYQQPLCLN